MVKIVLLGGRLKLYTETFSRRNAENLLLAAHGGVYSKYSIVGVARRIAGMHYFKVPRWTSLFFYAPHGSATNIQLEPYILCKYPPLEAVLPGESIINYDLGHVAKGLPYVTGGQIQSHLFINRYSASYSSSQHPFRLFDIVTTEPSDPEGTCLEEVLDVLFQSGHVYPRIHCTFCRHEYGTPESEYIPGYHNINPFKKSGIS